jgi:hypothetical protein
MSVVPEITAAGTPVPDAIRAAARVPVPHTIGTVSHGIPLVSQQTLAATWVPRRVLI